MDQPSENATLRPEHENGRMHEGDGRPGQPALDDLFAHFLRRFNELRDAGTDYLYATMDAWRVGMRNAMVRIVLLLACGFAAAVTLTTGLILLLLGLARAVSWLFSAPEWVGSLAVGVLVVGTPAIAAAVLLRRQKKVNLEKAKERYAARRERQSTAA